MLKVSTNFCKPYVLKNYVKNIKSLQPQDIKYVPNCAKNEVSKVESGVSRYHREDDKRLLYGFYPSYQIDFLWSNRKHSGTNSVKKIVRESMNDTIAQGRVFVSARSIDERTHPAGFFYKLGFRYRHEEFNKLMENWITSGGERNNAPKKDGFMFLPRENLLQCLKYGE